MAPYAKWTLRIELLETRLAVGVYDHERSAQPVFVSVRADGWASAEPNALYQCLDYEPICRWITEQWPLSEHTPLLETRVNELMSHLFALDTRVEQVWIGLYKPLAVPHAARVGVERQSTRRRFDEQLRALDRPGARTTHDLGSNACLTS